MTQALPKLAGAQGAAGSLAATVPGACVPGLRLGAVGHAAGDPSRRQVRLAVAALFGECHGKTAGHGSTHARHCAAMLCNSLKQ